MAERDRPHIVVPTLPASEPFTLASAGGGSEKEPFTGDRTGHGPSTHSGTRDAFTPAGDEAETAGTYITFVSFPGLELALESLDPQSAGEQPELLAVREVRNRRRHRSRSRPSTYPTGRSSTSSTVSPPTSRRQRTTRPGMPRWSKASSPFAARRFVSYGPIPTSSSPMTTRSRDGGRSGYATATVTNASDSPRSRPQRPSATSEHYLGFGDRTVVLLHATADELTETFESLDDIAELRRPHDVASFLTELPASSRRSGSEDLLHRLQAAGRRCSCGVHPGHRRAGRSPAAGRLA